MKKTWLITGSSRGLGRALVEHVLAAGDQVAATARKPEELSDLVATYGAAIRPIKLDVTSSTEAAAAVQEAHRAFGRLDVVVNNAGYGFMGAFEEQSEADFRGQIDTNFWGTVNVTRAAVPILRQQRSGHIIQITSIGGRLAVPGMSGYHAAKFAVEGLSEALAQEVRPFGVKVTIVEPGGFRTDWAGSSMAFAPALPDYASTVGVTRRMLQERDGSQPGDPTKAAQAILQLAQMSEPPVRLPLGTDAYNFLKYVYRQNLDQVEAWAELTRSTDFDGLPQEEGDHPVLAVLKGKSA